MIEKGSSVIGGLVAYLALILIAMPISVAILIADIMIKLGIYLGGIVVTILILDRLR